MLLRTIGNAKKYFLVFECVSLDKQLRVTNAWIILERLDGKLNKAIVKY